MDGPIAIDAKLTEADVGALFRSILRRDPDNPQFTHDLVSGGRTLRDLIVQMRASPELQRQMHDEHACDHDSHSGATHYRCPQDLEVMPTEVRRVLLIGSCLMHFWERALINMVPPCPSDLYLTGGELPKEPAQPVDVYDFQIIHLPLRSVLPDGAFPRLNETDLDGHERLLAHGAAVIRDLLSMAMRWNLARGLLTFVLPFVVPQQNPVGRLLPRYDLRNLVFFIEKLNETLAAELRHYVNAYLFDLNEVLATHGRRFVQEDMVALSNHGSFMTDFDFQHDGNRLESARRLSDVYESRVWPVITAAWHELLTVVRTIRQMDMVKLVVLDLDDTLWRGVIADTHVDALPTVEGWPRGFWEALAILKRRGMLLAIISQNDEDRVLEVWEQILGGQLRLEDFAARRIDWRSKPEKMAEILAEVNLLPGNVVFIDDNPLQRAEMLSAFPEIRVMGGDPFTWRHILLWAPETQVSSITAESGARTQMVQAQVVREATRRGQNREDFLAALDVRMTIFEVENVTHPRFPRVLELINKTNQFNTTGRRWTEASCGAALAGMTRIYAFELSDTYTPYGLVGVLILNDAGIRQFVMSCRVMGLDAELAAVAYTVALFRKSGRKRVVARLVETDRNLPCRNIFERCGFVRSDNGSWHFVSPNLPKIPSHINITAAPPTL